MSLSVITGLTVPFIGTALGAAVVLFMSQRLNAHLSRALNGFAAGVMTAASVWSLIIPAIEQSDAMGRWAFLPALIGVGMGVGALMLFDRLIPQPLIDAGDADRPRALPQHTGMLVLAVTLHNIPEGMAVGVVYAGLLSGAPQITAGGAFALALGIAIQNIPEGAIISMPLRAAGRSKGRSFLSGVLSGAVEPVFGALTLLFAGLVVPAMPYLLSFAAGAMLYVVVEELIPESVQDTDDHTGVLSFAAGFGIMMMLDVALG